MDKLTLPTRIEKKFIEVRGEYRDVPVEDRPYRVMKNQFNELRGIHEDKALPLSDMEILLAGGIEVFFTPDGKRVEANWPWTGEDARPTPVAPKKAPAKKKAAAKKAPVKKAKKKVSKKK